MPAHRARARVLETSEKQAILNAGITGHQDLRSAHVAQWVAQALAAVVDDIGVTIGFTCLAAGADQLFAQILHERHLPFIAVIACAQIEASFSSNHELISFRALLVEAYRTIRLPFDSPSEAAYFEAGKVVVDESEVLIAVWDGNPAKGFGGTADVVTYARARAKPVIHVDLVARKTTTL